MLRKTDLDVISSQKAWRSTNQSTTQVFIMPHCFDGTRSWHMLEIQLGLGLEDRDGMIKAFMRNAQS